MTRIIAGRAGGRRLATPRGSATRPTSDRVREALFSALESLLGSLEDLRVADLYAGSGALGLEAWSRGAEHVLLVEHDRRTAALVRTNARDLGAGGAQVVAGTVLTTLRQAPAEPYDVVLADPPYPLSDDEVDAVLASLVEHRWLAPDGVVVVERSSRSRAPRWPESLVAHKPRKYGETTLHLATHEAIGAEPVAR